MRNNLALYLRSEAGSGAAEFTLVLFPFIGLVFGVIGLSMLLYANQTLQYATQSAARYYSVQTANGSNPTTGAVTTYAQTVYTGPGISPTFVAATGSCGYQVTGTANFPLNVGLFSRTLTLQSHACYP